MRIRAFGIGACLVMACGCGGSHFGAPRPDPAARAAASEPGAFHYDRPLAAGRGLRLVGLNGAIEAAPTDGANVDVRAAVRGKDVSRVRVVAREEERGVVVCVLMADDPVDACRWDGVEHHHSHIDGDDARVDLLAKVPRGVSLFAATMNGGVRARGLDADVHATTMNGDVEVSTSGLAEAQTMNGDVSVEIGAGLDADVEASTMHGDITASFPMQIESVALGVGPKSGRATLGKGGAKVSAQTMNGDVSVRQRP